MIEYIDPAKPEEVKMILHPLVSEWFFSRFEAFSLTQLYAVKQIYGRKNILISAPTGGTKTLSAFLGILNYLVSLSLKEELEEKIYAIYCSPLKALSNDIYVNLLEPLAQIEQIAKKKGLKWQEIRVGLRTGDTTANERAKMSRHAPHILVTTPESLAIILTTQKFSNNARAVEFIVIDEIHALANKRGVYLSLTLERVCEMSSFAPVRIGLSATIAPLEEVAKFLVGTERECLIANVQLLKKLDIGLAYPGHHVLEAEESENQAKLYAMLDEIISSHRTTLIFTNTRSATERIAHHLERIFPEKYSGVIGTHHSSMSKEKRFEVEERLRKGELKVVISSTSLELGIDIGTIDIVVLLRSPKSVSRALQRIGRAGHKLHENPKGRFIVLDRDDLIECAVLMKAMIEGKIDRIEISKGALDVLAQQIYGMAISKIWTAQEMLGLIRKSYCYAQLREEDFFAIISYLAGDYALEHRRVYAKIWYDEKTGQIGKRGKLARVIYMTNIGTIAQEGFIEVMVQDGTAKGLSVGKIDEGFLEKMKKGDVFVLGGKKYQYQFSRGMKAYVKANVAKNPTIPSWYSEMLPLNFEVGLAIGRLRKLVKERLKNKKECLSFLESYLYITPPTALEIYSYFLEQEKFLTVPHEEVILVEKFKEEKEYLLFHSVYGRRVNDVLSRAYGYAAARLRHRNVEVGITDYGFFIGGEHLDEQKILKSVQSSNIEAILREAIDSTEVLRRRFRHCAMRSLMILKNYKGREKSVGKQQMHSGLLYLAVKRISDDFPILREARREVFEEVMDIDRAKLVLQWIEQGKVKVQVERTPLVSPFGLSTMLVGKTDLIKVEDRATFLKRMHQLHLKVIASKQK